MRYLILYFDGTSRPNPGKSACAYVIQDEKSEIIEKSGKYLGEGTNNIAEYSGLILGLISALKYKPDKIKIYSDSNLLIQQLNGTYKVKDHDLKKFHIIASELMNLFPEKEINFIPHEKNLAHSTAQSFLENGLF